MRSISSLLRPQLFSSAGRATRFRKGLSAQALSRRKQLRRLKRMNTYSRQYTGQLLPHNWLTAKRIKQIGQFLQAQRNIHPLSNPISNQIKQQMKIKLKQDADWMYYINRNQILQHQQQLNARKQCNMQKILQILPSKLKKQMFQEKQIQIPQLVQNQYLYSEQIQLILPSDIKHRFNMTLKLKSKNDAQGIAGLQAQQG